MARNKSAEAVKDLLNALELNPRNIAAMQLLAAQRFHQGDYREGEKSLGTLLAMSPRPQRRNFAEQFGKQFDASGKHEEAVRALSFMAWAFATSPEPHMLDPETAMDLAQRVVTMTKREDPLALDALDAAQAAGGKYDDAIETAQAGIKLANSQGKMQLAEAISRRLRVYQKREPYRCDRNGSDRP